MPNAFAFLHLLFILGRIKLYSVPLVKSKDDVDHKFSFSFCLSIMHISLNYWNKSMLIIFPQKKSMGMARTDEGIIFIIERRNVKLVLHDVG